MSIQPGQLLEALAEEGFEPANNAWTAGRMPPAGSCGLHPLEYFAIYNHGSLMNELSAQLGEPMPAPSFDFNRASNNVADTSFAPVLQTTAKIGIV